MRRRPIIQLRSGAGPLLQSQRFSAASLVDVTLDRGEARGEGAGRRASSSARMDRFPGKVRRLGKGERSRAASVARSMDGDSRFATDELRVLRRGIYACVRKRADALFELSDAILSAGSVSSSPHLSLAPIHRRGWGSLYAALSKGRIDAWALRTCSLATR